MNKLNEAQVDGLIELVRQRPALFNTADKYHKNFAMKEMIWGEISESLRADKKDCKTAWKSLRDQFVKAAREEKIKTGQDMTGRKTYKFYNKLLFLRESLHNKMPCKNETSMLETGTMDFDVSTMFAVNPMLSPGQSRKRKSQQYSKDDECIKEMLSEIISEIRKTNAGPPKGENDAFFMTLASMVNKAQLTPNYTRHFQRRIFNFVADELDQIERNK